jgi:hypothetical protein
MPDVNYTISGQVSKGALSQSFAASGITADMATAGMLSVTLNLGTSVSQVSTATLGSLGVCFARSLATATTHTVSFGRYVAGTLHEAVRLKAGEAAVLRLAAGDYAAKSAVEGSRLVLTVYED